MALLAVQAVMVLNGRQVLAFSMLAVAVAVLAVSLAAVQAVQVAAVLVAPITVAVQMERQILAVAVAVALIPRLELVVQVS
jgi:hypothetical protein